MSDAKTTYPAALPAMQPKTKRTLAKVGMSVCLGGLVATGLMGTRKSPAMRQAHLWSGIGLVGFSFWHYSLYNKNPDGKEQA